MDKPIICNMKKKLSPNLFHHVIYLFDIWQLNSGLPKTLVVCLHKFILPLFLLLILLINSACGGGGGGSVTASTSSVSMAGKVVDGYIVGGTATLDINDDWTFTGKTGINGGLPVTTTTDSSGNYSFPASYGQHLVKITGGVDIATNTPFLGQLLAAPGSSVATPLTTLVINQVMSTLTTPAAGVSSPISTTLLSAAETTLKTNLDISSTASLMTTDPVAVATSSDAKLLQLGTAVQIMMNKVTNAVASASGSTSNSGTLFDSIYAQAAKALPNLIATSSYNLTDSTSASSLVNSLVTQTVTKTNTAGLTSGLAPASVAAVASESIASQVNSVSTATATTLTTANSSNPSLVAFKDTSMQVAVNAMSGLLTQAAATANDASTLKALSSNVRTALGSSLSSQAANLINARVATTNSQIGAATVASVNSSTIGNTLSSANSSVLQQVSAGSALALGKTVVTVALTERGTQLAPAVIDGSANSGANNFTITAGTHPSFVKITGCSSSDTITLTGVGSNALTASNDGADMVLTTNISGIVTQITFAGVTPANSILGTLSAFNALGVCVTSYQ